MLTIYKASAGSGKTFTLAYEYLKQLLGVKERGAEKYHLNSDKYTPSGKRRLNRHRAIMAITFTNAATEEMKSRIVKELSKLTSPAGPDGKITLFARWMIADFGCTYDELQLVAEKALAELMYDYGNFNVSTIDAFFQTVLRTFSREVDHQGDYELSLETKDSVRQSVSLLLDDLNYANPKNARRLFDWISKFALAKMRNGKGYNFFQRDGYILKTLSDGLSKFISDETYAKYSEPLRKYLEDPNRIEAFRNALAEKIQKATATIYYSARCFLDATSNDFIPLVLFDKSVVNRLINVVQRTDLSPLPTINSIVAGNKPKTNLINATKCKKAKVDPQSLEPYMELLYDFCCDFSNEVPRIGFYTEIKDNLEPLDFYGMATAKLEEFLRDSNTVLISDTGDLLSRIISDAEMPFIYERLGMKLEHLLIDEFQDTSHLQWHNLRPLVANSLADGNDSLIIGDEKQAIYRFRNSDSELLGSIVQTRDFPTNHVVRGSLPQDNTNFRSAHDIVRVNNTIFSRMARILDVPGYDNVVQSLNPAYKSLSACIKIQFFDKKQTVVQEEIAEKMAQEIIAQHDKGYNWSDIMILTRRRKEAAFIVEYLTKTHPEIALLSSEALLLSSSGAVRTIMSMLKLVETSYSGKAQLNDKAPKYASQSDVVMMITRFDYYRSEGYEAPEALKLALNSSDNALGSLDKEVKEIRAENAANIVALIESIITHKLTPLQRQSEYAYITALQDIALKHLEGPDPSLASFIKAYDANISRWAIKSSGDIDAVNVMTVHKAKGLAAACIYIPFADWELNHKDVSLWLSMDALEEFDKKIVPPAMRLKVFKNSPLTNPLVSPFAAEIEQAKKYDEIDNLNLLYVAFTRAARELIVYSETKNIGSKLLEAVSLPADSDELGDMARCDLSAYLDESTHTFTLGQATTPKADDKTNDDLKINVTAGMYPVVFRKDTRELTSIDDAMAEHIDIGGEEDKNIVDKKSAILADRLADATKRGNDLHAIMASTKTLDDLAPAIAKYAARFGLDKSTQEEYYNDLLNAIVAGGELAASWFDEACKVYAERAIYDATAEMSFRPDRVVVYPDGSTTVIDYKFTSEPRPEHFEQVENYLDLMKRLGRQNITGYLWYPLLSKIKKVIPS
ncbi:MAG: UvrD-helicase domain-containing protein [Muribaculaceae bacterium]|nr:UvrD-helicase domain-containing protein [Muribaculaceae bacterium]